MPKCLIKGCPRKTGEKVNHPDVVLHTFPSTIERVTEWLHNTGHHFDDFDCFVATVLEDKRGFKFRICSNHFTEDSYIFTGNRKVLHASAIPTINLVQDTGLVVERSITRTSKRFREDTSEAYRSMFSTNPTSTVVLECGVNTEHVERRDVGTQTEISVHIESGRNSIGEASLGDSGGLSEHSYYGKSRQPALIKSTLIEGSTSEVQKHSPDVTPIIRRVFGPPQFVEEQPDSEGATPALLFTQSTLDESTDVDESSRFSDLFEPHMSDLLEDSVTNAAGVVSDARIVFDRKFVVFESCLDNLLSKLICGAGLDCLCPIEHVQKTVKGSFLSVTGVCSAGHSFLLWESQPKINNIPAGNLLYSASVLFSASDFKKVEKMNNIFGLQQISESSYYRHQKQFLFPVIHHEWQVEKKRVKKSLVGKSLCVGGDGQCDSPGHSAKYCAYTMMDLVSKRVIDFEVTQLGQCASSVALEKKAFEICLNRLIKDNFDIRILTTDRHESICKIIQEKYPEIIHQFNIRHYAKGLRKKLVTASRRKFCAEIGLWTDSVLKHFWWSVRTCNYNVELLKQKWESVLKHVINVHEWHFGETYRRCAHKVLTEEHVSRTLWLKNDSRAFESLSEIIKSPQITKDLVHLTHFCHTDSIETFHGHVLKFRPKRIHFEIDALYARTALAALAHNNNLKIDQAVVQEKGGEANGTKPDRLFYPNSHKNWSVRNVYESMSNSHLHVMMINIIRLCNASLITGQHALHEPFQPNIVTVSRSVKAVAVKENTSRVIIQQ